MRTRTSSYLRWCLSQNVPVPIWKASIWKRSHQLFTKQGWFDFLKIYFVVWVWMFCLHVYLHTICPCRKIRGHRGWELELELQVVVSHLIWVLGIEPGSSRRESNALNHQTISPVPRNRSGWYCKDQNLACSHGIIQVNYVETHLRNKWPFAVSLQV